jgi:hypothetical protein
VTGEYEVTMNGVRLTEGQSMTLRVAIETLAGDCVNHGLGEDAAAVAIAKGYLARCEDLRKIMRGET